MRFKTHADILGSFIPSQGVQRHGCSKKIGNSGLRKIGNFVLKNRRKIGKSVVGFVGKDSLPAPHQGYNKGYESSASMFAGFSSTYAAQKE